MLSVVCHLAVIDVLNPLVEHDTLVLCPEYEYPTAIEMHKYTTTSATDPIH